MKEEILRIVSEALKEDHAAHDITSRLLFPPGEAARARITAREEGVLCGGECALLAFQRLDRSCEVQLHLKDGARLAPGDPVLTVQGKLPHILAGERTALNFLQHLSGVATLTARFVEAVKGTRAKIYDTRKTLPGLRLLEKYAVRCGGGENHRFSLADMALVKDNHLARCRPEKLLKLKSRLPQGVRLVIEAKTPAEVDQALRAKADVVLLDNMDEEPLKEAIRSIRSRSRAQIEVSGGVTLETARRAASLGADRISVGRLTHSAPALDLSLDLL